MPLDTNGNAIRRRHGRPREVVPQPEPQAIVNQVTNIEESAGEDTLQTNVAMWWWVDLMLGVLVMLYLSYKMTAYLHQLHENDLWFSEITEVRDHALVLDI